MNNLGYIPAIDYYSGIKRNKLSSHEKPRKEPKYILLGDRSQCAQATHCVTPSTWHSRKDKTMETVRLPEFEGRGG